MKFQKLFTAIVVLLLAAGAGSAFAQDLVNCDDGTGIPGYVENITVDSITLNGVHYCYLNSVTVLGDVTVVNSGTITFQNSDVRGKISVEGSQDVNVHDSSAGRVVLKGNESAGVVAVIAKRAIRVNRNGAAWVVANAAPVIQCRNNIRTVGFKNQSERDNCDTLGR